MTEKREAPNVYDLVAARACCGCNLATIGRYSAQPIWFATRQGSEPLLSEEPLGIIQLGALLKDAPFQCEDCGHDRAKTVSITVDEKSIMF